MNQFQRNVSCRTENVHTIYYFVILQNKYKITAILTYEQFVSFYKIIITQNRMLQPFNELKE